MLNNKLLNKIMGKNHIKSIKSVPKSKAHLWKPLPIESEEFFTDKEFENLISFEVLTDYEITKTSDGTTQIKSNPTSSGASDSESSEFEAEAESEGPEAELSYSDEEFQDEHEHSDPEPEPPKLIKSKRKFDEVDSEAPPKKSKKKKQKVKKSIVSENPILLPPEVPESNEETLTSDSFNRNEWIQLGVPDILLRALEESKFDNPTPIQKLSLPASILGRKDIVGAAETGSGKTLAFALPILTGIIDDPDKAKDLKALILTPTRELAVQIKNHIQAVSKYSGIQTVVIVGGLASQKQERLLKSKPEIVIATPGRLWELIKENQYLGSLSTIKYLAIDETDRMTETGHYKELEGILAILNSDPETAKIRQNFIFSATLSFTHEPPKRKSKSKSKGKSHVKKLTSDDKLQSIMELVGIRPDAKIVDISSGRGTCETLTEMCLTCSREQKDYYLYYFFLCHPGRTIVFCNSINCVRRLVNLFHFLQCKPLALHSEMVQKQRLKNLERFAEDQNGLLIATDVAARGLDITDIEHVIHYQVPKTAESYIHRSGRTARAYKGGLALVLIEPSESTAFRHISISLGREKPLPNFDVDGSIYREIKSRVDLAIRVESYEHQLRKKSADSNWVEKAKKEMDLASDSDENDDESPKVIFKKNIKQAKSELESMKSELATLISTNPFLFQRNTNVSETFKKLSSGDNLIAKGKPKGVVKAKPKQKPKKKKTVKK